MRQNINKMQYVTGNKLYSRQRRRLHLLTILQQEQYSFIHDQQPCTYFTTFYGRHYQHHCSFIIWSASIALHSANFLTTLCIKYWFQFPCCRQMHFLSVSEYKHWWLSSNFCNFCKLVIVAFYLENEGGFVFVEQYIPP